MSTTLKCQDCQTIHAIECPACQSGRQRVMGSLSLSLLDVNVEVSIAVGKMGTCLHIQKPSGQVLIPLQDHDLHVQPKLKL